MLLQRALIDREGIAEYKQISQTVYDDVLNAIILDAQIHDIAELLGEELFNDILVTTGNTYNDLLNGCTYVYNDITYHNYGLRACLAYYVYARYQMFGGVVDTPFGLVEKLEGNESRPVSDKTKERLYQLNRDSAFAIWKSVENYLIRTNNVLFKKNRCINKRNVSLSIRKIQ